MFCMYCGKDSETGVCPSCAVAAQKKEAPKYYDFIGAEIDLPTIHGAYKTDGKMRAYLKRWTNYSPMEIDEILEYIVSSVEPKEFSDAKALLKRMEIESYNRDAASVIKEMRNQPSREEVVLDKQLAELKKANKLQEKQMKDTARCPRCGSTSLSGHKKGFGIGKAVIGAAVVGPLGLVAGNAGARKVRVTCLNCGKRWKA